MTPRIFFTRLGDREVTVEIAESGPGRYSIKIDGSEEIVDARAIGGNQLSLLVGGRLHEVSVVRTGDEFDLLVANHRFRIGLLPEEKARKARALGAHGSSGRREIKASMPGKVVDVLVKVGDAVESQQGLLIVEAMKMENEIRAPGAGEVKEIRVRPGVAVEGGEILLIIE